MKKIATGLLIGLITLFATSLSDINSIHDPTESTPQKSGTPLPDGWLNGTLSPDGSSGSGAYYAEYLFWDIFQGQKYDMTDTLFTKLYDALEENPNDFSKALIYGRLGWTFLWIYSEADYALLKHSVDLKTLNQAHITTAKKAVKGPLWDTYKDGNGHSIYPDNFVGIQIASHYFGLATKLVLDIKNVRQRQDWTNAEGSDLIPGSELAWRTFPSVVTGFYASFNDFPKFGPAKPKGNRTMPMAVSMEAISYSSGFNFATHVFGDSGGGRLEALDLALMFQMFQLGADPAVGAAVVPGNNTSYPIHAYLYQLIYPEIGKFYDNNPELNVMQQKLYPPASLATYWNKPVPWKGFTPAEIVKASCGTSLIVPHNFENNIMMLGDTFVATYYKKPGKGEPAWQPPNKNWKPFLLEIYGYAQQSTTWKDWPYKDSINKRIEFLNKNDFESLYIVAQNYGLKAVKDPEHPKPSNPLHYPTCMTCHQNG